MTILLVALGAAVGAPLRFLTDRAVRSRHDSLFPWGTFSVNVVGSLILGLLAGGAAVHAVPGDLQALLGAGLCGALTTYSTFGYETVTLAEERAHLPAVLNAAVGIGAGLGAAFLGWSLATIVWA